MYQKLVLENKANVYLVPQKDAQSATVLIMFPVGSRYENEKLAGVSHFIEHLMFKGTKKRPNTLILTREIDRLGAEYNAFTSKEYTGYYIKADAKYLETSLDILSDMLYNSLFDAKEMEKEKRVIVEEIRMYKDNPLMNIENIFENLLFRSPLGRDIAGSEKTVLNLNRREMLEYLGKYYQSKEMTVVIAGKYEKNIKKILEKYFSRVKALRAHAVHENKFAPAKFGKEKLKIEQKKTDQTQLMLGWPGFNYQDALNPVVAVMNTIFGGSMSSRLFIEIREKRGLAYLVRSGADNFRDAGYLYVRAGLEAKNINQTIQVVKVEIQKLVKKGVSPRELKDAKTHIRGALTLSLEDSSAQASWYAKEALFMKKIENPGERLKEIEKVTNAQIKALAKKVFDWRKVRVAIIGDVKREAISF